MGITRLRSRLLTLLSPCLSTHNLTSRGNPCLLFSFYPWPLSCSLLPAWQVNPRRRAASPSKSAPRTFRFRHPTPWFAMVWLVEDSFLVLRTEVQPGTLNRSARMRDSSLLPRTSAGLLAQAVGFTAPPMAPPGKRFIRLRQSISLLFPPRTPLPPHLPPLTEGNSPQATTAHPGNLFSDPPKSSPSSRLCFSPHQSPAGV